jgi:hypothetical protein
MQANLKLHKDSLSLFIGQWTTQFNTFPLSNTTTMKCVNTEKPINKSLVQRKSEANLNPRTKITIISLLIKNSSPCIMFY